ncbi:MAG TPA: bifunctional diaminohydroxyphosphoribosylaminopyrimidine deaminase/5-amino-6-(5-phosphoribosylamino)uracil reductase RibD [Chitinophagales bacterium]
MNVHEKYMLRAIELAEKGLGSVSPNPLVGAVLVYNDKIIGEGFHEQYGKAHAEVNCLNSVREEDKHLISEATLYVTLEPCSHYGKTPPCADLIIANKIPRVVVGHQDPFAEVAGKGIARLRENGVEVTTFVLEKESAFQNRRFLTFQTKKRPYIILKWAESADGFIAPKDNIPYWLTNEHSKKLSHKWRTEEDAIMVGYNTVLRDNPQLTARLWKGRNPVRIVIDEQLALTKNAKVFNDEARTIIFNFVEDKTENNLQFIKLNSEKNLAHEIAHKLYAEKIQSVIIEGGTKLLSKFIAEKLWDEARIFKTEIELKNGIATPKISAINATKTAIENDLLLKYYNL